MLSPVVSVVIPIYNHERFLGKCIRSVLKQSFQNFELILVNSGSTDKSLSICQKYEKKDSRISIINKQNEGLAQSRKDGFLKACGDYILFIDSDDYMYKDAISTLLGIATEHHVDMVVGNYDCVCDDWGVIARKGKPYNCANRIIKNRELKEMFLGIEYNEDNLVGIFVLGNLYRRSCMMRALNNEEDFLFPPHHKAVLEDLSFNLVLVSYIQTCWVTNKVLYHYRYGGVTSRCFPFISEGGYYFDYRYDQCLLNHCEHFLLNTFRYYQTLLIWETCGRMHYRKESMATLRVFLEEEYRHRKICIWAEQEQDFDIDEIITSAIRREKSLQKRHYWKKAILRIYQNVVNL